MNWLKSVLLLLFVSVLIVSCKKNDIDSDVQSSIDHAICEQEFMKLIPIINSKAISQVGISSGKKGSLLNSLGLQGCPLQEIIIDTGSSANTFPNRMIVVYDTVTSVGCLGSDGKLRKGKVTIDFYYRWDQVTTGDSLMVISLDDYTVNEVNYDASIVVSKPQTNQYRTQITNGKVWNSSFNLKWDCDRRVTWTDGSSDSLFVNDVYEITGEANGTNRNGLAYEAKILSSLVRKADCSNITSGTLEITPTGKGARTFNYGDASTCDEQATVTIAGNTFTINTN